MHVMFDLETWGLRPGSDIRSIGAVVFDPVRGMVNNQAPHNMSSQFYRAVENPVGIWRNGEFEADAVEGTTVRRKYLALTRDPETVKWWSEQDEEAQAAFADPVDLMDGLEEFGRWLYQVSLLDDINDLHLWSNGPNFDVTILEEVHHKLGMSVPWHYRAPRCFRTVTTLAGMKREEFCKHGVAHHSLHDAIAQAKTVCAAYKKLGIGSGQKG